MLTRYNFCKPELTAHVSYPDHSTSICPSVNNSHFRLLQNRCRDFNETSQEASTQGRLSSLFILGGSPRGCIRGLGPRRVPSLKKNYPEPMHDLKN